MISLANSEEEYAFRPQRQVSQWTSEKSTEELREQDVVEEELNLPDQLGLVILEEDRVVGTHLLGNDGKSPAIFEHKNTHTIGRDKTNSIVITESGNSIDNG